MLIRKNVSPEFLTIGSYLMVHLVITEDFKRQFIKWEDDAVPMKDPRILIGQKYLTVRKMNDVVMHTSKLASISEATKRMVKYRQ